MSLPLLETKNPSQLNLFACKSKTKGFPYWSEFKKLTGPYAGYGCRQPIPTIPTCGHLKVKEILRTINGPSLPKEKLEIKANNFELPPFIPQVKIKDLRLVQEYSSVNAVSINQLYLPSKTYGGVKIPGAEIRQNITSIPSNTILINALHDGVIETIWSNPVKKLQFYQLIKKVNFGMVTSFDFSLYWEYCLVCQAISSKKTYINLTEMQTLGINAVPNIFTRNRSLLDQWIELINSNPNLSVISLYLTNFRSDQQWQQTIDEIKYLGKKINHPAHFIFIGPSRPKRIKDLAEVVEKFSIITTVPEKQAALGNLTKFMPNDELAKPWSKNVMYHERLKQNILAYQLFIKSLKINPNNKK